MSDEDENKVQHTGHLEKKGLSNRHNWKRRFMVLSNSTLSYYKAGGLQAAGKKKYVDSVDLKEYVAVGRMRGAEDGYYRIVVRHKDSAGKHMYLRTKHAKELDVWVKKLRKIIGEGPRDRSNTTTCFEAQEKRIRTFSKAVPSLSASGRRDRLGRKMSTQRAPRVPPSGPSIAGRASGSPLQPSKIAPPSSRESIRRRKDAVEDLLNLTEELDLEFASLEEVIDDAFEDLSQESNSSNSGEKRHFGEQGAGLEDPIIINETNNMHPIRRTQSEKKMYNKTPPPPPKRSYGLSDAPKPSPWVIKIRKQPPPPPPKKTHSNAAFKNKMRLFSGQ